MSRIKSLKGLVVVVGLNAVTLKKKKKKKKEKKRKGLPRDTSNCIPLEESTMTNLLGAHCGLCTQPLLGDHWMA